MKSTHNSQSSQGSQRRQRRLHNVYRIALLALFGTLLVSLSAAPVCAKKTITPRAQKKKLQNGIRLILVENRELPYLQISLVADAGSRFVAPEKSGLAEVTVKTILQGAGDKSGAAFQRHVDSIGAQLRSVTTREGTIITLSVSRNEMIAGLRIIKDLIHRPALNETEFANVLNRQKSHVLQAYDVGYALKRDIALETLFPDQAFGAPPMGTPTSLANLTIDDVREYELLRFSSDKLTIVIAGDIDARRLGPDIAREFASISRTGKNASEAPTLAPAKSQDLRIVLVDVPGKLSASVGFYALTSAPTDTMKFAADRMLTHLLGAYPDISFFGRRLVENRNLVSRLKSKHTFMRGRSFMQIEMNCAREHVVDVVAEGLDILRSVEKSRISIRELEEGKQFFRGYYALAFECATDETAMFSELALVGLQYRYHDVLLRKINALTQTDIRNAAQGAFNPDNLVIVVYGDARSFAGDLTDFGRVIRHPSLSSVAPQ